MTLSLKVKFANGEIEASAENPDALADIVNKATKKFFPNQSAYHKDM